MRKRFGWLGVVGCFVGCVGEAPALPEPTGVPESDGIGSGTVTTAGSVMGSTDSGLPPTDPDGTGMADSSPSTGTSGAGEETTGAEGTTGEIATTGSEPLFRALLLTEFGTLEYDLDATLDASLQSMGAEVVVVEDELAEPADADDVDIVVISETCTEAHVGNTFREVARPVVVLEGKVWDDMSMTTTTVEWISGRFIEISDDTHPIADPHSGLVEVLSTGLTSGRTYAYTSEEAQVVARLPAADIVEGLPTDVVFAYPTGAVMFQFVAPDARVGFGVDVDGNESFMSISNLTPDGESMFEAAVAWALVH